MNHLCSTACLLARFDEPEPFVDAARDLGEDGSRSGVLQFTRLRAGVACMSAKVGECRRKRIDVAVPSASERTAASWDLTLTRFGGVSERGSSLHLLLIGDRTDASQRGMQSLSIVKRLQSLSGCSHDIFAEHRKLQRAIMFERRSQDDQRCLCVPRA